MAFLPLLTHFLLVCGLIDRFEGESVWRIFTDEDIDGDVIGVADAGPFVNLRSAQACAIMAGERGVSEITPAMVAQFSEAFGGPFWDGPLIESFGRPLH